MIKQETPPVQIESGDQTPSTFHDELIVSTPETGALDGSLPVSKTVNLSVRNIHEFRRMIEREANEVSKGDRWPTGSLDKYYEMLKELGLEDVAYKLKIELEEE